MNNLILLRGSAGCGKSTWVKENNLSEYTLCADNIRLMVQSPVTTLTGDKEISQKNDNDVWKLLFELLERRMGRGEFTIIDATHTRAQAINKYKSLCDKYRYRCYIVDFSNIPIEEVKSRNSKREDYKKVPESVIDRMYSQMKEPLSKFAIIINPEEFYSLFRNLTVFNYNKYNKIHFIGDIHGCYEPLKEYFDTYVNLLEDAIIFVGDYLDRGIQNFEVFKFLYEIKDNPNVLMLIGNHEEHWNRYAWKNETEIVSKEFKDTIVELLENGIGKKELREVFRRMGKYAFLSFDNKIIFSCHAGYPVLPNYFTASQELIKGIGKYESYLEIHNTWNNLTPINFYQIHGHRNVFDSPIKNGRCFNLEGKVEFGGNLRCLLLEKGKDFHEIEIKNNIFKVEMTEDIQIGSIDSLVNEMRGTKLIQEKDLGNNIHSFNFTREAFYNKNWDNLTTKARGLFINVETKEIVARGYEKFFNIGEKGNDVVDVVNKFNYPVSVYIKENGYLGIVGYNSETDSLFISSKTTDKGDMANNFKEIFNEKAKTKETIKQILKEKNISLLFEVIDPISDPHIIEYNEQKMVLLDAFYREIDPKKLSYDELLKTLMPLFFEVKKMVNIKFDSGQEFYKFYKEISQPDYLYNGNNIEGFVFEDSAGYMVKFKTDFYKKWKFLRGLKERMSRGSQIDTRMLTEKLYVDFYSWLRTKEPEYLKMDIISLRNEFEKDF